MVFQAAQSSETKSVIERVSAAFGNRLRFDAKDKEAMSMWDTTEQFQFFDIFMLSFNAFLGIIGVLTLIVGGIGVSNIMNVVVEERPASSASRWPRPKSRPSYAGPPGTSWPFRRPGRILLS